MKLEKLRNFFQLNECSTPQGEIHEDDFTELRSLPFIQSFILYPCVTVAVHCMRRCRIERHMIESARNAKQDEDLDYDINNTFPRFVRYVEKFHFPTKPEEVTDINLEFVNAKLSAKMAVAIHVTLLSDIIDTFNWFGFNGKVEFVENTNHLLHLYVK